MKRRTPQQRKRSARRLAKMDARRNWPFLKSYVHSFYEASKHYPGGKPSIHDRMMRYALGQQPVQKFLKTK